MSDKTHNITISLPLCTILSLIFMTLKLCNVITWSWWWVWAPIWLIPAVILGIFAIIFLFALFANL